MISLRFKSTNYDKLLNMREHFHNALVGNQSYIDSINAICDDNKEDSYGFLLVIGESDSKAGSAFNLSAEIDIDSIKFEVPYLPEKIKRVPIAIYIRGTSVKKGCESLALVEFKSEYGELIVTGENITKTQKFVEAMICGTIPEAYKNDYIKLTHHADVLYKYLENIHVEVLLDGKWHGLQ